MSEIRGLPSQGVSGRHPWSRSSGYGSGYAFQASGQAGLDSVGTRVAFNCRWGSRPPCISDLAGEPIARSPGRVGDGRDSHVGIGNPVEDHEWEPPEAALPVGAVLPPKWPALGRLADFCEYPVDLFDERDFQSRMLASVPRDGTRDFRLGSGANEEAAFSDHVVLHRSGHGRGPLTILRPKKARAPHSPRADPAQQATPLPNLDRVGRPIGPGPPPRCPVDCLRGARARSGEDPVLPWSRPLVWQERRQPTTAGGSLGPHASIARQGERFDEAGLAGVLAGV